MAGGAAKAAAITLRVMFGARLATTNSRSQPVLRSTIGAAARRRFAPINFPDRTHNGQAAVGRSVEKPVAIDGLKMRPCARLLWRELTRHRDANLVNTLAL